MIQEQFDTAVKKLISRVLPQHWRQVDYRWCEPDEGRDVYEIGWPRRWGGI